MANASKVNFITDKEPFYPSSDGKPMADNTLQFDYIVKIKTNLELLFRDKEVFIAGDLFWYPVEGAPKIVAAPDVMVVFGCPKGHRLSYKQWEEGNVAPQVIFEVLSKSNSTLEMLRKQRFYEKFGVEEYIIIDPYQSKFEVFIRENDIFELIETTNNSWTSKRLGISIEADEDQISFYFPEGHPFRTLEELNSMLENANTEKEKALAEKEKAMMELEKLRAELEQLKNK